MESLVSALAGAGVVSHYVAVAPASIWKWKRRGLDVLHLQWPEYLGTVRPGNPVRGAFNAAQILRIGCGFLVCRLNAIPVVWTVHNLRPHDPQPGLAKRVCYFLARRLATVAIVHSESAARRVVSEFGYERGSVVVAPHGNYAGAYPEPPAGARVALRKELGVGEADTLLLAFGRIRKYKRIVELCRAVADSDRRIHLLVAGQVGDQGYEEELAPFLHDPRIHLRLKAVPSDEVSALYAAADLAVLNYEEVFSSGALLLALTQGLAVVSSRSDTAAEVAQFPAIATYGTESDIGHAVQRLVAVSATERTAAATAAADRASWSVTAEKVAAAYRLALGRASVE